MSNGGFPRMVGRILWPLGVAALIVWALYATGEKELNGFTLDLGSILFPRPLYSYFLLYWSFFGATAAFFLTLGLLRLLEGSDIAKRIAAKLVHSSDKTWIALGSLAAFSIPAGIRTFILQGAPLTDDESAYRFLAQLVSSFRLYAPSPPMKLFFDNAFMINDGKMYPQYFVGWPALLAPGIPLGAPGYMNAFYSALTVFPLFHVLKRLTNTGYAKLGLILYLTAPMLMVAAATEMAHTTCFMALVWMTWFFFRSREGFALWAHTGLAVAFCLAFINRPLTAIGIGLPFLAVWATQMLRLPRQRLLRAAVAFFLPAFMFACLFLAVNKIQNGSMLKTSYARELEYARENSYRFSGYSSETESYARLSIPMNLPKSLAIVSTGLLRLNFALLGWPVLFAVFLPLALFAGSARLPLCSFVTFLIVNLATDNPGIDSFGPVHYTEAGWPAIMFVVAGLHFLGEKLASARPEPAGAPCLRYAAPATALALVFLNLAVYTPVRFRALHRMGGNIAKPEKALKQAGIHNAVIFTTRPFVNQQEIAPTKHFVFFRPNNDPDLRNDNLWANHLGWAEDQQLMRHFPGRTGYVMQWQPNGTIVFTPLPAPGS